MAQGSLVGIVAVRTRSYGGCSYVAANIGRVQEGNCRLQLAAAFTAGPYERSKPVTVSTCLTALERHLRHLVEQRSSPSTDSKQEDNSAALSTSQFSAVASSGDYSASVSDGYQSVTTCNGTSSLASTAGMNSIAVSKGSSSMASCTGKQSVALAGVDHSSASVTGSNSIAIATDYETAARGCLGSWLVLAERSEHKTLLGVQAVKVDGELIKPNIYYKLEGGKVVEAESLGGSEYTSFFPCN